MNENSNTRSGMAGRISEASASSSSSNTSWTPDDLFKRATQEVSAEFAAKRPTQDAEVLEEEESHGLLGGTVVDRVGSAVVDGVLKAGFETKDFLLGEPQESEKSGFRKRTEAASRARNDEGWGYGLVEGVAQFATGMIGLGKVAAPLKIANKGRKAKTAFEIGRGAAAGGIVMDPHEERLSDLIQTFPALQNPVSEYLQSDPTDSAAEGRFKNALEGMGMDLALVGVFALAARGFKLAKAGRTKEAAKVLQEAEKMEVERANKPRVRIYPETRKVDAPVEAPQGTVEGRGGDMLPEGQPAGEGAVRTPEAAPGASPLGEVDEAVTSAARMEASALPAADASKPYNLKTEVTDEALDAILKTSNEDLEALTRYGSREAATEAGHRFAAEARLPWQKLRSTPEVQTFVDSAASVLVKQMDAKKGGAVLSDPRVRTMISQRAQIWGEDPDFIMGQIAKAGEGAKRMVADMEAGYLIAQKMQQDAYETTFKIRNGMLDEWDGNLQAAHAELKDRIAAAIDLTASARSITANAGRALRRMRSEFQVRPEDVEKIKSLDADKLVEMIYATKGNPKKMAQMANPSFMKRVLDETTFSLTNSLLWLYPTHTVNTVTNLYMLAARPTEKIFGSLALQAVGNPQYKGIRQQAMKEYAYTVAALGDAWEAAVEAFKRGDSILAPHGEEFFEGGRGGIRSQQLPWKPVENITDVFHNAWVSLNYRTIVGLPTRALGTMDEFMKTMRYRAVVQARAAVEANEQGLEGAALQAHIEQAMERAFDGAGRGIDPAALKEAQTATFQQELLQGTLGKVAQDARAAVQPLTFVLPFVKTPVNVLRYGWKMTPMLNLLQKEYREMISGALGSEAQAQAIGQMTMGSIFMGLAAHMAFNGQITGAGPRDPKLQRELRNTGWQPYSFVVHNRDGSKTYFPLGRFEPVSIPFALAADLAEMQMLHLNPKQAEAGIGAAALAIARNISDQSFLMGLSQLVRVASDPEGASLSAYFGNMAGNTVPLSSLIRGTNPDPYLRDARGFIDNMMRSMWGYSETLPPVRDAFGEPVWRKVGLSTMEAADLVEAEHNRIIFETGHGITTPAATRDGVDLRDFTLETGQNAYDRLQELAGDPGKGPSLKDSLAKVIRSEEYAGLVDGDSQTKGTKLYALMGVVVKYRQAAFKLLLKESPELREAVSKRQRDTVAAIKAKRGEKNNQPGAQDVLDALGYGKR